jgi:twitching motility protein PilT
VNEESELQEQELVVKPSAMVQMRELMTLSAETEASDVHLKAGSSPVLRINGELVAREEFEPLRPDDVNRLFHQITSDEQRARFERDKELDLSYGLGGVGRFRVNVASQRGTLTIVMRRLSSTIPDIAELGLPEICKELVMEPSGLILVTGPTGSGRSTTLASMVNHLNAREARRIITIEDPIEYLLRDRRCFVTQRELGSDTHSYADALRHALRQDPDVILVGQMGDLDTIGAALTAAETGHLVLSTLNTIGATQTIDRLVDVFPPFQQQQIRVQLAGVIQGVLSQVLVPVRTGTGRTAAVEVMLATPAIRNLIREGKTAQIPGVVETSGRLGMQTLDQALLGLCEKGIITADDAMLKAQNREVLRSRLRGA